MQPESSEAGEKCVSATGGPAVQGPAGLRGLRCRDCLVLRLSCGLDDVFMALVLELLMILF